MNISVTFRHLDTSTALKEYAEHKVSKINKFIDGSMEASVVLSVEKFRKVADVTVTFGRHTINCAEETSDMYESIDKVVDKIERQVKKQRQKVRNKKGADMDRIEFEAKVQEEKKTME